MNDDTKEDDERPDDQTFTYEFSDEELEAVVCREGRFLQTLESSAANCCRLDFVTDRRPGSSSQ